MFHVESKQKTFGQTQYFPLSLCPLATIIVNHKSKMSTPRFNLIVPWDKYNNIPYLLFLVAAVISIHQNETCPSPMVKQAETTFPDELDNE